VVEAAGWDDFAVSLSMDEEGLQMSVFILQLFSSLIFLVGAYWLGGTQIIKGRVSLRPLIISFT
jgi:hypothetical protein